MPTHKKGGYEEISRLLVEALDLRGKNPWHALGLPPPFSRVPAWEEYFPRDFRRLQRLCGWSYRELERRSGIPRSSLERWVNRKTLRQSPRWWEALWPFAPRDLASYKPPADLSPETRQVLLSLALLRTLAEVTGAYKLEWAGQRVAEFVQRERKRLRLNQKELARKAGIGDGTLSSIERGRLPPLAREHLLKLEVALGKPLPTLLRDLLGME